MHNIITFINEKGGIGKTSICFNTAWEISKSHKILMVDMDGQKANLTFFCGIKDSQEKKTMFQVFQDTEDIKDIILPVKENLDLIPGNVTMSELPASAKVTRFRKALAEVRDKYDAIFIDVNPTPNRSHMLSLSASTGVIIPMLPDIASLEANNGITESIEEIRETTNPSLKVIGLLFNQYTGRTNLSKEVYPIAEKMAGNLESHVFKTTIRKAVSLSENVYAHKGITDYAPRAGAAEDYRNFVKELETIIF